MTGLRQYRPLADGTHPPNDFAGYGSSALRHPKQPPIAIPQTLSEITGPVQGFERLGPIEVDLTAQHAAPAQGERIIVEGMQKVRTGVKVQPQAVPFEETATATPAPSSSGG